MTSETTQSPAVNDADAELILFPDSNHGSHFQFTDRFVEYVIAFVDR
jgi:hypothetical protein